MSTKVLYICIYNILWKNNGWREDWYSEKSSVKIIITLKPCAIFIDTERLLTCGTFKKYVRSRFLIFDPSPSLFIPVHFTSTPPPPFSLPRRTFALVSFSQSERTDSLDHPLPLFVFVRFLRTPSPLPRRTYFWMPPMDTVLIIRQINEKLVQYGYYKYSSL